MAERSDKQLAADVVAQLRRNTFLEPLGIQVLVDNGVVTLVGSIDSQENRQSAEDTVRLVAGVEKVVNQLTVIGEGGSYSRSDADIQREVLEQMEADPTIQTDRFHVDVRFGTVFVTGAAESLEERESVIAAVERVPGVQNIQDRMEVRAPLIEEPTRGV